MESSPEQTAEGKAIVTVLACVLARLIEANSLSGHEHLDPSTITKFHALQPPAICVSDYLERIHKYSSCSNECFVLSLIYIDRLIQFNNFALTSFNVHRVVITSIMVAAKFFDDQYYNNAYYAKVGGVPCGELNSLEAEFLFGVNFGLHVTADEFYKYRTQLINHAATSPCACRGVVIPPHLTNPVVPTREDRCRPGLMGTVPHNLPSAPVVPSRRHNQNQGQRVVQNGQPYYCGNGIVQNGHNCGGRCADCDSDVGQNHVDLSRSGHSIAVRVPQQLYYTVNSQPGLPKVPYPVGGFTGDGAVREAGFYCA